MKSKKELSDLKEEVETVSRKLHELTEDELAEVIGGSSGMDIAERVIRGDYGNGEERKYRLRADGYDYGLVQNEVNQRLGDKKMPPEW